MVILVGLLPLQQLSRTKGSCSKSWAQKKELKGWGGTPCPGGKDSQETALLLLQAVVQFLGSRTGILADLHGLEVPPTLVTPCQVCQMSGVAAAGWASTCRCFLEWTSGTGTGGDTVPGMSQPTSPEVLVDHVCFWTWCWLHQGQCRATPCQTRAGILHIQPLHCSPAAGPARCLGALLEQSRGVG